MSSARPRRTPVAWCYARASHENQYGKKSDDKVVYCDTVDRQIDACKALYDSRLAAEGVLWGGHEVDSYAVSASKVPFLKRPAAIRLMAKMQPGDHLIFDKVDRMWRRIHDYVHVDEALKRNQITMHIVNLMGMSVTRGTAMGDAMLGIFVVVAQLESQMMGDRIRANVAWRKARGLPVSKASYGKKKVKHGKQPQIYIADLQARAIGQEIIRLRDAGRLSWLDVAETIERIMCKNEGREFKKYKFKYELNDCRVYQWTPDKCRAYYRGEKNLLSEEAARKLGNKDDSPSDGGKDV